MPLYRYIVFIPKYKAVKMELSLWVYVPCEVQSVIQLLCVMYPVKCKALFDFWILRGKYGTFANSRKRYMVKHGHSWQWGSGRDNSLKEEQTFTICSAAESGVLPHLLYSAPFTLLVIYCASYRATYFLSVFMNLESGKSALVIFLKYTKRWWCNSYQRHFSIIFLRSYV